MAWYERLVEPLMRPLIERRVSDVARRLEEDVNRKVVEAMSQIDTTGWRVLGQDTARIKDTDPTTLREIRTEAWKAFLLNPLAKRQVRYTTANLVGRGFAVSSPDPDIQRALDEFVSDPQNHWEIAIRELVNRFQIDGEAWVLLFTNKRSGNSWFRDIETDEVVEVMTDPRDYRKIIGIKRQFVRRQWTDDMSSCTDRTVTQIIRPGQPLPDGDPWVVVDIHHWRMPSVSTRLRGVSDLASHLRYLKIYDMVLWSRAILNRVRAALVWDVTVEGNQQDVEAEAKRNSQPPEPGTVKVHSSKVTWDAKVPSIGGNDAEPDLRALKLMIVAGSGQPEHVVTGDASNANYASTAEASHSYAVAVEDMQDIIEFYLKRLLLAVVKAKQQYGDVPKQIFRRDDKGEKTDELLPETDWIQITWPEIRHEDPLKQAQAIELDLQMGLVSKRTAANLRGYDYDQEQEWMAAEKAKEAAVGLDDYQKRLAKELGLDDGSGAGVPSATGSGPQELPGTSAPAAG